MILSRDNLIPVTWSRHVMSPRSRGVQGQAGGGPNDKDDTYMTSQGRPGIQPRSADGQTNKWQNVFDIELFAGRPKKKKRLRNRNVWRRLTRTTVAMEFVSGLSNLVLWRINVRHGKWNWFKRKQSVMFSEQQLFSRLFPDSVWKYWWLNVYFVLIQTKIN